MNQDLTVFYDVSPPSASVELSRLLTELDKYIWRELRPAMDRLDEKDRSFGANLLRYYFNMMKHGYTYMTHIRTDVQAHWQRVYRAMARDYGEQNWQELRRTSSYEINSHLNDKIRKRLKRKASNKKSLRREFQRWIDFSHYLKLYMVRYTHLIHKGTGLMMRFLENFTTIPFGYKIWYERRIPQNLIEMESLYSKKKGLINLRIWMWYRKEIYIVYKKLCRMDLLFIPKPRLSNRGTNLVHFMMIKIVEEEDFNSC